MKKYYRAGIVCLLFSLSLSAQEPAQDPAQVQDADAQAVPDADAQVQQAAPQAEQATSKEEQREVKKGWAFGAFPCLTYSNDVGFQYGAFGDVYYYGNGDTYPDPLHKISFEVSHYTKGRTRAYLAYDSKYLIPKMRITASATYVNDPLYLFFGFRAYIGFLLHKTLNY